VAIETAPRGAGSLVAECGIGDVIVHVRDIARSRSYYEELLGLRVAHAAPDAVSFDAGPIRIWLADAGAAGVELTGEQNDCTDLVFLTEDCAALRGALERRGVEPVHQRTYSVGTVVDFYDPDGHRLMLYEPSQHAMETEVAERLRTIWRAGGRGGAGLIGPSGGSLEHTLTAAGLDGKPLSYMFFFLEDMFAAREFFEDKLGLTVLQLSHCCSDACPDGNPGVIKYDGGWVILSIHHIHGHETVVDDAGRPYAARQTDPVYCKGLAPAFRVDDLDRLRVQLSARGVRFRPATAQLADARLAAFDAPSGHLFYLCQTN
jgi:catechol 2,3-dioxygenase-like lactoylglutathione lyase family enzyme